MFVLVSSDTKNAAKVNVAKNDLNKKINLTKDGMHQFSTEKSVSVVF